MQKLKYLLKAELYKHKSLGFIRFYCIIMLIVGVGSALPYLLDTDTTTLDWFLIYNNLLANPITINLIITGMAAMYHIKDINDKSIHHVITSGYTKGQAILSRIISISIISSFAYLLYIFAGVISTLPFISMSIKADYGVSIACYIFVTFFLKVLFIIALNVICMTFAYLVRSAAAFFIVVFTLWISALNGLYNLERVQSSWIYKGMLQIFITLQDYLMFMDRIGREQFEITLKPTSVYLVVVVLTIIVFHKLTCLILNKIEIK